MSKQSYKIFLKDRLLLLTNKPQKTVLSPLFCLYLESNWEKGLAFFLESNSHSVLLYCESPKILFKKIKAQFKVIKAGGGLMYNPRGEILAIKRLGKWDFPKGKLDAGETWEQAALREVEEEVGIKPDRIKKKICNTYHIHKFKGRWALKKTKWYKMEIDSLQEGNPQLEEDITEVSWKHPVHIRSDRFDTYASIRELIYEGGI